MDVNKELKFKKKLVGGGGGNQVRCERRVKFL